MISRTKFALLATGAVAIAGAPAWGQETERAPAVDAQSDIIVTARRVQERLQDVPISITVLRSEDIANNNIVSAGDIAAYTPNLAVNNRGGDGASTFVIRGFSQEGATTATVGTYFGEVVAPRGASDTNSGGDGAGPGQIFDLENIQILKGPQGTLFGRNSTGGAVLLVPTKPKRDFEGYVEGSLGNYDMRRIQGVLNVPINETFRVRFAADRMKRDGYLKNLGFTGRTGRQDLADADYTSLRLSVVGDLTPNLENYLIASYSESEINGQIPSVKQCFPGASFGGIPTGNLACAQIAREASSGYWTVSSASPYQLSKAKQWQLINTTTWQASDGLEVKNILSYSEYFQNNSIDFFGTYFPVASPVTGPGDVNTFANTVEAAPFDWTTAQSTFVEELRFSGRAFDGRLDWQAGLYYELSSPLGWSGQQSSTFSPCADVATLNCQAFALGTSLGAGSYNLLKARFEGKAAYAQASYKLTDRLTITGGIRYTEDKVDKTFSRNNISFTTDMVSCANRSAPGFGVSFPLAQLTPSRCAQREKDKYNAPTWLIGLEYKPVDELMLYAKYARGYRQGNINAAGPDGIRSFRPEKVDFYEVGAKADWHGAVPGRFSVAGFYNGFRDQQISTRLACDPAQAPFVACTPVVGIVNVGRSKLYGFEADLAVRPFEGLEITAAYSHLNTKINSVQPLQLDPGLPYNQVVGVPVGQPLPYAVPNAFTGSVFYTLPLPESIGRIRFGGTLIYTDEYITGYTTFSRVPSKTYGNVNASWDGVMGMPIDLAVFVTNVTNKKMILTPNDQSTRGFNSYLLAPPRMWGVRLKYRFGGLAD